MRRMAIGNDEVKERVKEMERKSERERERTKVKEKERDRNTEWKTCYRKRGRCGIQFWACNQTSLLKKNLAELL